MHQIRFWIGDFGFWIYTVREIRYCYLLANPKFEIQNPKSVAGVAQLVERQPSKLNVASSSLVSRSKVFLISFEAILIDNARVAQG